MPDSNSFRLFVAVEIPDEVKVKMAEAQDELRQALPSRGIRWAKREQFHLTLRFLGNVEATRVGALEESIRGACRGFAPLQMCAERVGFFPDAHRPRVAWIGVEDKAGQLARLQHAIETAVADFTAEEGEERFAGHVTLARIKGITRPEAEALAKAAAGMAEQSFGFWTARELELMRSELSPQGARHSSLAGIALAG